MGLLSFAGLLNLAPVVIFTLASWLQHHHRVLQFPSETFCFSCRGLPFSVWTKYEHSSTFLRFMAFCHISSSHGGLHSHCLSYCQFWYLAVCCLVILPFRFLPSESPVTLLGTSGCISTSGVGSNVCVLLNCNFWIGLTLLPSVGMLLQSRVAKCRSFLSLLAFLINLFTKKRGGPLIHSALCAWNLWSTIFCAPKSRE